MRPLILLSNDDGIDAPGLLAIADELAAFADLLVVAPERERSAVSHAITLHKPLRPKQLRDGWYSISGTPADCVYIGLLRLAPRPPNLVVSGINSGPNLGSDVFYSGTAAAAVEGALRNVAAIALSQSVDANFAHSARFGGAIARAVLEHGLPRKTLLNVNIPADPHERFRWTKLGERVYRDQVEERDDLRGRTYYWIGGPALNIDDVPDSDGAAVREGLISVTPLRLDLTAHDMLAPPPTWAVQGYEPVA